MTAMNHTAGEEQQLPMESSFIFVTICRLRARKLSSPCAKRFVRR
jgi:hypothetical protein